MCLKNFATYSGVLISNFFQNFRFALSFGLDALKNREAVAQLHREGILVSVNPMENNDDPSGPPPNLPFLEILTEFTNKLLKQDKKVVLKYLDQRIGDAMPSRLIMHPYF